MAIYHFAGKIISKGKKTLINDKGQEGASMASKASAVASAAYRAGEKLFNEIQKLTFDYTTKGANNVLYKNILIPEHAPKEYLNRQILWNAVEKKEKNINAQLSREINIALPHELTVEQNIKLINRYVYNNFVKKGMCADFAIHAPNKYNNNIHAHVMLTMRPIKKDGTWDLKKHRVYKFYNGKHILDENGKWAFDTPDTMDWNKTETFCQWRENWAKECNLALEKAGRSERIDHRSYKEQGIDQQPTKHMGKHATALERKGIETEKGNYNRHILSENMKRAKALVNAEIKKIIVDFPTVSEVLKKSVEIKSPNIEKIPTGEVIQRRTYTPSSGVVREGDPSTPKLHDISPVNGENHVPPRWRKNQKSADTLPFRKEKRSTLNSAVRTFGNGAKLFAPDMESRLKFHISPKQAVEQMEETSRLLKFINKHDINGINDLTNRINKMDDKLEKLQNGINRCDDISKRLESLKQAAVICRQNYSIAETYSNKKLFKAMYYNHHKQEIDNFIEAQRLLRRTGRYDENTKPEEIEEIIEAATSKREALVNTLRDQKNEVVIFKIRKTEMEQLLGIDKKPLTKERSKDLEYRIEEIKRQQTPQRDKDNRNEREER